MVLLEIARQNGNIIEQTKPHGAARLGMMPRWTYGTEHLRELAAHHRVSSGQRTRHSFQGSVKRIAADDRVRIKRCGSPLARHLDQLQQLWIVHLRNPVLGVMIPGEMDQLSGTSARLKSLHNGLKAASTLRMMHTRIV